MTAAPTLTPHLQSHVNLEGLFWKPPLGICEGAGAGLSLHGPHPPPLRGRGEGIAEDTDSDGGRQPPGRVGHMTREIREPKDKRPDSCTKTHILGPRPRLDHG